MDANFVCLFVCVLDYRINRGLIWFRATFDANRLILATRQRIVSCFDGQVHWTSSTNNTVLLVGTRRPVRTFRPQNPVCPTRHVGWARVFRLRGAWSDQKLGVRIIWQNSRNACAVKCLVGMSVINDGIIMQHVCLITNVSFETSRAIHWRRMNLVHEKIPKLKFHNLEFWV